MAVRFFSVMAWIHHLQGNSTNTRLPRGPTAIPDGVHRAIKPTNFKNRTTGPELIIESDAPTSRNISCLRCERSLTPGQERPEMAVDAAGTAGHREQILRRLTHQFYCRRLAKRCSGAQQGTEEDIRSHASGLSDTDPARHPRGVVYHIPEQGPVTLQFQVTCRSRLSST